MRWLVCSVFGELWFWTPAAGGSLLCRDLWPAAAVVFSHGVALRMQRAPAGRQQALPTLCLPVSCGLERGSVERGACDCATSVCSLCNDGLTGLFCALLLQCSQTCGAGVMQRTVECPPSETCSPSSRPESSATCRQTDCECEPEPTGFTRMPTRWAHVCVSWSGELHTSCRQLQMKGGVRTDGEHHIRVHSKILRVYCAEMQSGFPREYVTLRSGQTENYSEVYGYRWTHRRTDDGSTKYTPILSQTLLLMKLLVYKYTVHYQSKVWNHYGFWNNYNKRINKLILIYYFYNYN